MTFVPTEWQNSLKSWESNCFPLSMVSSFGSPNLQIMFCQKNFLTALDVIFTSGFASIHFEVFHRDNNVFVVALSCWQWANQVYTPSLEWPRRRYELYWVRRSVGFGCHHLASFTSFDYMFGVFQRGWPKETLSEGFGDQQSYADMGSAEARVYFPSRALDLQPLLCI